MSETAQRPSALTGQAAQAWRAAQPPTWRHALAPVLLWVVTIVAATVTTPDGGCTPAQPCGADWWGAVVVSLALAAPVLLLWWWPLGRWVSVVAALSVFGVQLALGKVPLWVSVLLPALALLATAHSQLDRTRRARAAQDLLRTVPTEPFPGAVPRLPSWPWPRIAAVVLLATAPLLLAYGVVRGGNEAELERGATQATGTVTGNGADGYAVTIALGDRTETLSTRFAKDYPVGSEQPLLVLPDGRVRLAAERYDPSGYLAAAIAAALAGLALGGRAQEHYGALRRLLTEPAPVHQIRLGAGVHAQVLPVDADAPLVATGLVLADPSPAGQDSPGVIRGIEDAVLFGAPLRGGVIAVVLSDGTRLLPLGRTNAGDPARQTKGATTDVTTIDIDRDSAAQTPGAGAADADVQQWRSELLRPDPVNTGLGVLLVAGSVVAAFFIARESGGVLSTLWRCALAASFAFDGLVRLASRVRLTPEGLVHEGPTLRRTVPWSSLTAVTVEQETVLARTGTDDVVTLTWLPKRPRFGGKEKRRAWARRWAAVIADEARQHSVALTVPSRAEPRLWGPALATVFTAAVVFGLQAR